MIDVVLGIAIFVMAIAVVGLFAMMGELASRVRGMGDAEVSDADHPPHALAEARVGAQSDEWPSALAAVRDAEIGHLFVFGSTCASCVRIASGETGPLALLGAPLAVVVSCPRAEDGQAFIASHPLLHEFAHHVDVGGEWVKRNFGVGISPSVLVFHHGRLRSAHTFVAATALARLGEAERPHVHAHSAKPSPLARGRG
jgi:hypothetical protein